MRIHLLRISLNSLSVGQA